MVGDAGPGILAHRVRRSRVVDPPLLAAIDLEAIPDPGARRAVQALLNLVEQLAAENQALREENQRLRDEVNRLKG